MEHVQAPLWEALKKHNQFSQGNFHVPGHKQGMVFESSARRYYSDILSIDLTEVGNLDDLHHPMGVIQDAQELAADAFGSEYCFFLVGGTTAGNLAAIYSMTAGGKKMIVQRESHQSVFHGLMLSQSTGIALAGKQNEETGLEGGAWHYDELYQLMLETSDVGAVMITSPSYFGVTQDISKLAEVCHHFNVPLIVDEAHGAHFSFHPRLPASALEEGADLVIQSTHKMLPAMTMASMLHIQGERVNRESIAQYLRMLESSSPSYPLMASLDLARKFMVLEGEERIEKTIKNLEQFRRRLSTLSHLKEVRFHTIQDLLRITIKCTSGASGYQFANELEKRGVYPELANHLGVLFIFSVDTGAGELESLYAVLQEIDLQLSYTRESKEILLHYPIQKKCVISYQQYQKRKKFRIPLRKVVGFSSADWIIPYPPGVPLLIPGEKWLEEHRNYLEQTLEQGGRVRGVDEELLVWVWSEEKK